MQEMPLFNLLPLIVLSLLSSSFFMTLGQTSSCGGNFIATNSPQLFSSPDSQLHQVCNYAIISSDPNAWIILSIVACQLAASDYLRVYKYRDPETVYYDFDNYHCPVYDFIVPQNTVLIQFYNGFADSQSLSSFQIKYSMAPPSKPAEQLTATETWNYITSPNFPEIYPSNNVSVSLITAEIPDSVILFQLTECEIENPFDSLKIYQGTSMGNLLYNFDACPPGNDMPFIFNVTNSNDVLVVFEADYVVGQKGFNLTYAIPTLTTPAESTLESTTASTISKKIITTIKSAPTAAATYKPRPSPPNGVVFKKNNPWLLLFFFLFCFL